MRINKNYKKGILHGCVLILFCVVLQPQIFPMAISYYETLPESCPEEDAHPVDNGTFFRLIGANPAVDTDFHSHKKLGIWPGAFKNASECLACAISIWNDLTTCQAIQKLPKNKSKSIAKVILNTTDGDVKQTGKNANHHSWWRADTFEINNITYL